MTVITAAERAATSLGTGAPPLSFRRAGTGARAGALILGRRAMGWS